jgi:MFS transporter, CP family, cyanate transporter
MTGCYVMALCLGAATAAGATVPLARHFEGSWSAALAFWAAPAALAAAVWLAQLRGGQQADVRPVAPVRGLWTDALAWQLTLFMGLQSAFAYIVFGWLAPILRDRGLNPVQAGLVVSASILAQAAASLVAPLLATIGRDQKLASAVSSLVCIGTFLACMFGPLSWIWAWSILLGLSEGALFAIALMLIVLRSPDAHVTAHLSGMSQGVGYILACAGPLFVGLLHGWSGNWRGLLWLSLALGAVMLGSGIGASRARHVQAVSVGPEQQPL